MKYPAIVYREGRADTLYADNLTYQFTKRYELMVISRNPDEALRDAITVLPMCSHERGYVADGLTHHVFTIYH